MWDLVPICTGSKARHPKSLFLIPLSLALYFVPGVGISAQKSDLKSHLSFAFYFVPEVGVGAQKSDFKSHLSFAFYFVPEVRVGAQKSLFLCLFEFF